MRRSSRLRSGSYALTLLCAAAIANCGRVDDDVGSSASDGGANEGSSQDSGGVVCSPGWNDVNGACERSSSSISDASTSAGDADASDAMDMLAPCMLGGNRFFIAGDDYVYSGAPVSLGPDENWLGGAPDYAIDGQTTAVSIQIWDRGPGLIVNDFDVNFNTQTFNEPIKVGDYSSIDAFGSDASVAFEVSGDGHGCDHVSGDVHVYEITSSANDASEPDLHSFTATFVQHCERRAEYYNYGCVHVENCRDESCPPFSGDP